MIGKKYGMYFNTGLPWSGVMLILYIEIKKLVATAVSVNRLKWFPNNGTLKPKCKMLSYCERSSAHKKLLPRRATFELKKLYKAKKIGTCNKPGIQPPKGFTPASLKSFICSMLICCWSLPYLAFNCSISGRSTFILAPLR